MSEQALDLSRSLQIVRRHKIVVGVFAALGLRAWRRVRRAEPADVDEQRARCAAALHRDMSTQVVIASSDPVLSACTSHSSIRPCHRKRCAASIQVKSLTSNIISISAQGKTAAQAEDTANAVADSYVAYVNADTAAGARAGTGAVLQPATNATGTSLLRSPARYRRARRPGRRADRSHRRACAQPRRPAPAGARRDSKCHRDARPGIDSRRSSIRRRGWTKLLEDYEPGVVACVAAAHRPALSGANRRHLLNGSSDGDGFSLAVLSLPPTEEHSPSARSWRSSPPPWGSPRRWSSAPSRTRTLLPALRAACAEPPPSSKRSRQLRLAVADHDDMARQPGARLTVVVAVVDGRAPSVADTMRASTTVLGVSAGAVTAAQLVGVAVSAATDGRQIDGILVADPDPADHTTGRVPQLARPARRRMPTRLTGTTTETRR